MNCEGCEVWTLGELGPGTLRGIAKISVEAFGHEAWITEESPLQGTVFELDRHGKFEN